VKPAVQGNGGLTNAIRGACDAGLMEHKQWVGTIGFPTDNLEGEKKEAIESKLEVEYDALTVFVDDKDFDGFYAHYCKTILWPVLHYQIPDHPKSKAYQDHSWIYYVRVNEAFAEKIVANYKHGDTIWVHDYHLLLVPSMIRKKLPEARISFFLHTAFPSSEVFRCLAVRKELLEGMLGANLIAFQAQEYAHHFLQTCSRLLVVEATEDGIQLDSHFVTVTNAPIGVVPKQFEIARREPEVAEWIQVIQEKYEGKHLIVARDKLDSIRGVRQKLLSFEIFLKKNEKYRENVVLVQVATSSSVDKDLENHISDIVTRINSQYSTLAHQPLVFLKQDIVFSQYLALLSAADMVMITSLRDGMNLTCHEFVLCQNGELPEAKKFGPLILSEFTGSSSLFQGNDISVNPWDYQQCARAIKYSIEMSQEEKERRYVKLLNAVKSSDGVNWVRTLMDRLYLGYDSHQLRDTMSIPRLSIPTLSTQYKSSNFRLFILDYEGTLATWGALKKAVISSPERVIDTLDELMTASSRNIVYITSSRQPLELELMFNQLPGVGLIAENGCFIRPFSSPSYPSSTGGWVDLADVNNATGWKADVSPILTYYQARVPGSWIEERSCSLVFHYNDAESGEAATRLAGDCTNHINDSCTAQHVHAVPIDKGVRIESTDVTKMTAARWVFNSVASHTAGQGRIDKQNRNDSVPFPDSAVELTSPGAAFDDTAGKDVEALAQPDFLMVAGDDREDEGTFRWANLLAKEGVVKNVVSICVGKKSTEAGCTLTQGATGMFLESFTGYYDFAYTSNRSSQCLAEDFTVALSGMLSLDGFCRAVSAGRLSCTRYIQSAPFLTKDVLFPQRRFAIRFV